MSRVFRERQSRRVFEELQQLKSSCARAYEELEAMHTEVLMGKGKFNNLKWFDKFKSQNKCKNASGANMSRSEF